MQVSFHEPKRAKTLKERGLDFAEAVAVFEGQTLTLKDERYDYGEERFQTIGVLREDIVMVVWTPREEARHIMSMRKCNDKETRRYHEHVDRSG